MESLNGMKIFNLTSPHFGTNFMLYILEKYVPRILRDRKKDEFMALEYGYVSVDSYEDKLYVLSR